MSKFYRGFQVWYLLLVEQTNGILIVFGKMEQTNIGRLGMRKACPNLITPGQRI